MLGPLSSPSESLSLGVVLGTLVTGAPKFKL